MKLKRILLVVLFAVSLSSSVDAAPRMISYRYPNCMSCHISIQGAGLLNPYGEAIDSAQSLMQDSETSLLQNIKNLGLEWDATVQDIRSVGSINLNPEDGETSGSFESVYRNVYYLNQESMLRSNIEVSYSDREWDSTLIGGYYERENRNQLNLRKLTLEWRFENEGASGKELVIGRDYLPQGLQGGPSNAYYRLLTRAGRDEHPTQLKLFQWDANSLNTLYAFGPSGEELSKNQEWGTGGFYEHYLLGNRLAIGAQGLVGFSDAMDRTKFGLYARYGITQWLGILTEANYSLVDLDKALANGDNEVDQWTTYTRIYLFAREWLIPSATFEYAYLSNYNEPHFMKTSFALDARISRNFSLGIGYSFGDIGSSLNSGELFTLKASFKP